MCEFPIDRDALIFGFASKVEPVLHVKLVVLKVSFCAKCFVFRQFCGLDFADSYVLVLLGFVNLVEAR